MTAWHLVWRHIARSLWRFVCAASLGFAALLLFLEEFGWRPLSAFLARFSTWPAVARTEARIKRLPPRPALALFLVPIVVLLPVKVLALALMHAGHTATGLCLILAAKLLGTALAGRLFVLLEPQLVQFAWFVKTMAWWHATKKRVIDALHASSIWRKMRSSYRRWRVWWRRRVSQLVK